MGRPLAYAQHAEDLRIRRVFGERSTGFYIDVGAADPVTHSVTHLLYQQGWRGVNIEPLEAFFAELDAVRADDVNLHAVVATHEGSTRFYEVPEMRGSSTDQPATAAHLRQAGHALVEHDVHATTLRSVCERYAPDRIDVLKVDVEGAEFEVLASNDWSRFRPRLVLVEANGPDRWEPLLLREGYLKATFDGVNNWYVEAAEEAWIETLAKPLRIGEDYLPADGSRPARVSAPRPRMLVALSSSNQLYSGTGRVIFQTLARVTTEFEIAFAIDDADARNTSLARDFCAAHDLVLHVGTGRRDDRTPDALNTELPAIIASGRWDLVYAVSWANAATNSTLLEHLGTTALAYVPMHQPSWSIGLSEAGSRLVEEVHTAMLRRADVVFCQSPWERMELRRLAAPTAPTCAVVCGTCDFDAFTPGSPERGRDLLFVGDVREPRKRLDRVIAVLAAVREHGVDAHLVIIGNQSTEAAATVPVDLAAVVTSRGYVTEDELCQAYRDAAVVLLLSEFEAYGLPTIEALASATPVVMTHQPAPASVFTAEPSVHFVDPDDTPAVAAIVTHLLLDGEPERARLVERHAALAARFDWDAGAGRTRDHLLAAWAHGARAGGGFGPVTSGPCP